jgi:hypothetical protein
MSFQLERFVTLLQTTLSQPISTIGQLTMQLTSVTGLPSSGQIRALLSGGGVQEIVLATLPADSMNNLGIERAKEPVGTDSTPHTFSAGATVDFIYTAGNLTNDPRSMAAPGDLETLNADGQVTRIPVGPNGSSYFVVNGLPVSAPGVDAAFTNPASGTDPNDQFLSQAAVTWDSSQQLPQFSNYQIRKTILNVIHGQNDPDGVSKKTFLVNRSLLNARACGQRIGQASTVNGWGGGDVFAADHTVNYACGVTANGDEGQFISRGKLNPAIPRRLSDFG